MLVNEATAETLARVLRLRDSLPRGVRITRFEAHTGMRPTLRAMRDEARRPVFTEARQGPSTWTELLRVPLVWNDKVRPGVIKCAIDV